MQRLIITITLTVGGASVCHASWSKAPARRTMNWATVVCEWRVASDDLTSSAVNECFKKGSSPKIAFRPRPQR